MQGGEEPCCRLGQVACLAQVDIGQSIIFPAKAKIGLAVLFVGGVEADFGLGRIMAFEHARARRRIVCVRAEQGTGDGRNCLAGDAAGTEKDGFLIRKTDNRAFDAHGAGPAIKDPGDLSAKPVDHMLRRGRADPA